jgi:uncharacterized protein
VSQPFTDPIAPAIRADIAARLSAIEVEEPVRYLVAVESWSRAWGFPSPDSDYDVRFIYVRPRDWYLRLDRGRDVIEQPIVDDIDLNGWDIRKALGLLLKSNAIVSEWLSSPIRYRPDHPAATRLAELADMIFDPRATGHHYASLGRNAAERWLTGEDAVPVKKYFYALRPALTIRALRHNPMQRPAMNLQALMLQSQLSPAITAMIEELVDAKRRTNELANGARFPELDRLISDELGRASDIPKRCAPPIALDAANALFLDLVNI